MTTAIIPANGASKRWLGDHTYPKQLARIDGECIINRIVRQCKANGVSKVHIVTRNSQIIETVTEQVFDPGPDARWLAQTILATRNLWNDKTIFLFSDVVWADTEIRGVFQTPNDDLYAFGKCKIGEMFAVTIGPNGFEKFSDCLEKSIEIAPKIRSFGWTMFTTIRFYYGLKPDSWHKVDYRGKWIEVDGWTGDVDNTENFDKLLAARQDKYVC